MKKKLKDCTYKQRPCYFNDQDWDEIRQAAEKVSRGNRTAFIEKAVMKEVKRVLKGRKNE